MARVLILGGTEDATALCERLAQAPGVTPIVSFAGRTTRPNAPAPATGETRIGGFGGAEGLEAYMRANDIAALVDATHPFASAISENARVASARRGVPRIVLVRPAWSPGPGDDWREVAGEADAASTLPPGATAFLALGAQRLAAFAARQDVQFVVRVVDAPIQPLLPFVHEVVTDRGPFDEGDETRLFAAHRVTHIVARNSGGAGAAAKLAAARALRLPVLMIRRPPPPEGPVVASAQEACDWVIARMSGDAQLS